MGTVEIIRTGQKSVEQFKKEFNTLLNQLLRELQETKHSDDGVA